MDKIRDISSYLNSINLREKFSSDLSGKKPSELTEKEQLDLEKTDPLEFLIEDNLSTNPNHKYIVRKIVSQLEVRDHINNMGPALMTNNPKQILLQIINDGTPSLVKKMLSKYNQGVNSVKSFFKKEDYAFPAFQVKMNDPELILLPAVSRKRTIFDFFRFKSSHPQNLGYKFASDKKSTKILDYYLFLPDKITKRENELSNLKWNDFKRRHELKKEIKDLKYRKDKTYESILKLYSRIPKFNDGEKEWQDFYLLHEKEMLEWIKKRKEQANPEWSDEEMLRYLEESCEGYFTSVEGFDSEVNGLRKDIRGNLDLMKTVYGRDFKNDDLLSILQVLRETMDGKLMRTGIKEYRNIYIEGKNSFLKMCSKEKDIVPHMNALAEEYEELKMIEDTDEYIDKAIDIFQRLVQIHPYFDGNGRTSRALLDIMLINRNIVPPILYDTYYDREILDSKSIEYLADNNKEPLRNYIKAQIKKVQPYTDGDQHEIDKKSEYKETSAKVDEGSDELLMEE